MKIFKTNQNKSERILRLIMAVFMVPAMFIFEQSNYSFAVSMVGFVLLFNAIVGTCYTYWLFGVNTCERKEK